MTVIAAWSVGMVILWWLNREPAAWAPAIGVVPAVLAASGRWTFVLVALLSGLMMFVYQGKPGTKTSSRDLRAALARFWQQVAVLLTAGLTFWQAVEVSVASEPLIRPTISRAADSLARRSRAPLDLGGLPPEDGPLTLLLLQHGYLHGVGADQIASHVRHLQERLAYEDEAKKRRDPVWMTVLPAMLLLNVLWVFLAPMVVLAGHSWLKL